MEIEAIKRAITYVFYGAKKGDNLAQTNVPPSSETRQGLLVWTMRCFWAKAGAKVYFN